MEKYKGAAENSDFFVCKEKFREANTSLNHLGIDF